MCVQQFHSFLRREEDTRGAGDETERVPSHGTARGSEEDREVPSGMHVLSSAVECVCI